MTQPNRPDMGRAAVPVGGDGGGTGLGEVEEPKAALDEEEVAAPFALTAAPGAVD